MVVTHHPDVADRVRALRDHGRRGHYTHALFGYCSRLDEMHAAALRVRLGRLDAKNARRQAIARRYDAALSGVVETPYVAPYAGHVYHQYVIRTPERDRLREWLAEQGIQTGIHYPIPCHLQDACRELGYSEGSLPVTEAAAQEILSLPVFPELTDEEVDYVIDRLLAFPATSQSYVIASPVLTIQR
jgi:UDP-N-acetyl-3-dehydro-alpha-D-glucosamine 3-aminotranferase